MNAWGSLYRTLLLPAWERARGRTTLARLSSLERTQWESRARVLELQAAELRRLVAHAERHVPYWRESFARHGLRAEDVRGPDDLRRLPPLDKQTIREQRERLVDRRTRASHIVKRSSGTSGQQTEIEYDRGSEAWRQAVRIRGWGWAGYRAGDRVVYYWGQPEPLVGVRGAKIRLDRALRRERYLDCLVQRDDALAEAAREIARQKPRAVVGYAVALGILARFVLAHGLRDWDDVPVLTCAEPLSTRDRADLTAAFGPGVFETYGARETMLLATECEEHAGLHTMDDAHLVEVVVDGRPARPGEVGEVLVTDLHNYGMPLIRYRNGDLAVAGPDAPCRCGRGLGRIGAVAGRTSDTLRDAEGAPIPGMALHSILATHAEKLREAQLVQRADRSVVLRVVRAEGFREETTTRVTSALSRYLRGLPLTVEYTDAIERGPAGKFRPVVVEAPSPVDATNLPAAGA